MESVPTTWWVVPTLIIVTSWRRPWGSLPAQLRGGEAPWERGSAGLLPGPVSHWLCGVALNCWILHSHRPQNCQLPGKGFVLLRVPGSLHSLCLCSACAAKQAAWTGAPQCAAACADGGCKLGDASSTAFPWRSLPELEPSSASSSLHCFPLVCGPWANS